MAFLAGRRGGCQQDRHSHLTSITNDIPLPFASKPFPLAPSPPPCIISNASRTRERRRKRKSPPSFYTRILYNSSSSSSVPSGLLRRWMIQRQHGMSCLFLSLLALLIASSSSSISQLSPPTKPSELLEKTFGEQWPPSLNVYRRRTDQLDFQRLQATTTRRDSSIKTRGQTKHEKIDFPSFLFFFC